MKNKTKNDKLKAKVIQRIKEIFFLKKKKPVITILKSI